MRSRTKPIYGPIGVQDSGEVKTLYAALELLKARGSDGPFYLVASYFSPSSASAALNAINADRRLIPEGEYEYKTNVRRSIGRSYLYARRIQ